MARPWPPSRGTRKQSGKPIVAFLSEELADAGESGERLLAPLTPRKLAVQRLVAAGMSNGEIAGQLVVASTTVKKHLHNASTKLRARNRTHAAARARELDVLTTEV